MQKWVQMSAVVTHVTVQVLQLKVRLCHIGIRSYPLGASAGYPMLLCPRFHTVKVHMCTTVQRQPGPRLQHKSEQPTEPQRQNPNYPSPPQCSQDRATRLEQCSHQDIFSDKLVETRWDSPQQAKCNNDTCCNKKRAKLRSTT